MAVSHIKVDTIADFTGTVTVYNSQGSTQTANATDLVRPSDWNSVHNQYMTITGNTAGVSTVSGTNLIFSGGANVTLSGTSNSIGIAVPNQSVQTQGMVSVNGSTGSIVFSNANSITFGGNASTITASFSQSNPAFSADASSTFQTITFQNGNGVSFSNNAGALRITHDLQYTSNTSNVTSNALNTSASRVINMVAATNNTGGGTASLSGNVSFSAANGLTFYTSAGNAVVGSYTVPTQTNQTANLYVPSQSTQLSSTAGVDLRSLSFGGAGIVSVGVSGGSVLISATGGGGGIAASLSGNSTSGGAGFSNVSSGTLILAGGNNITLSQDGSRVTISGANAGGAQTGISGIAANGSTFTSGSVYFSNLGNISISTSVNGASQYVQLSGNAAQTTQPVAWSGSGGSSAFSTLNFSNASNFTFSNSGGSVQVVHNLAGTSTGTAGANVGLSMTLNSSGLNLSATVAAQSVQPVAWSGSGGSSLFSTLNLSNASNITFSNSGGSVQVIHNLAGTSTGSAGANVGISMTHNSSGLNLSVTVPAQTNQTLSWAATGNTTANTSGITVDARSLTLQGLGGVSVGYSTSAGGSSIVISGATGGGGGAAISAAGGSQNTGTVIFSNANGVTFGFNAGTITATVNPGAAAGIGAIQNSNTTYTSGTVAISEGGGAITIASGTGQKFLLSVPATSSLVGASGISVSTNGSTISIIAQPFTGSWYQPEVYGNTTPLTMANGTLYIRPFELDGYFDVDKINMFQSFNSSRSTASFSASVSNASSSSGSGSWGLTGTYLIFSRVQTVETAASYASLLSAYSNTYSMSAGYSASCSWNANVSSATNSVTTAYSIGFPGAIDSAGGVTYANTGTTGTTSFSSTSTNANSFSSSFQLTQVYSHMSGLRAVFIPAGGLATTALSPGEYWIGIIQSTNTGSTNFPTLMSCASMSDAGRLHFTASTNNYLEFGNSVAFTTSGIRPLFGSANVSSATTTQLQLATFSNISSQASMWFALDGRTK